MYITIQDEKGKVLGQVTLDADAILEESDAIGGNLYDNALLSIKREAEIAISGYVARSEKDAQIKNALRDYASIGVHKGKIILPMKKSESGGLAVKNLTSEIFEQVIDLDDKGIGDRYQRLVGLDDLKAKMRKEAAVWMAPEMLEKWSKKHHKGRILALDIFGDRYPFFILEGDVGAGKTEFAETFGYDVAQFTGKKMKLARMSMKSRGNGMVGEMSKLISQAFIEARKIAEQSNSPVIVLLDEADSLAQSREGDQMHHEDRAGVNALIQGIDKIRETKVPVMVVFCTNRVQAIDPALKRRAAVIETFTRPDDVQRQAVLEKHLFDLKLTPQQVKELVKKTGPSETRAFGFTYSDLVTRLLPEAILAAYPDRPLSFEVLSEVVQKVQPTPPFKEQTNK